VVDSIHDANFQPRVAFDAAGNSILVWTRWSDAGDNQFEVVAQRFGAAGRPRGPRFRVSPRLSPHQSYAVVAMNASGQFAVAWVSYGQDGQISGIYARAFGPRGAAVTAELAVNTSVAAQSIPTVGLDANGAFVVAWYNELGLYVRRFAASGAALGPEARVAGGSNPKLAVVPDGSYLLVWREFDPSTRVSIVARRFARSGAPISDVLPVSSRPIEFSGTPGVATTPDGGFLVAWDRCNYLDFSEGCEIRARRFDAHGSPRSPDVTISPADHRGHEWPAVGAEPGGFTAVSWQDCALDGGGQWSGCKIQTLFFDPSGQRAPAPNVIEADANLLGPVVAAGPGSFLVAFDTTNCDSTRCDYTLPTGVYGWRYRVPRQRP
jgi:hypothetical protein